MRGTQAYQADGGDKKKSIKQSSRRIKVQMHTSI